MKSTGIVRRIDELGRIVIPKEIRKNFRIKEGENLEIFISEDETIMLKKHSIINKFKELADNIAKNLNQIIENNVLITDMNNVISYFGTDKNNFINKKIKSAYFEMLKERKKMISNKKESVIIVDEMLAEYIITPIIINGDLIGSIVIFADELNKKSDLLIDFATKIIISYIE